MTIKKKQGVSGTQASSNKTVWESAIEKEQVSYAEHASVGRLDINLLAQKIAVEVTFALAERIEELNVMSAKFRSGLQKTVAFSLTALFGRKERCLVVPDAVPGFTMMAFKKTQSPLNKDVGSASLNPANRLEVDNIESLALLKIAEGFYNKENGKILVIDCPDAIFALFPVAQLEDNLKMLGYYHVD